jgi:ribonuclease P protein component
MPHGFGPERRLHSRREFVEAFEQGLKLHGRFVTVFLRPTTRATGRLGLTVSRKFGNAVRRNLAKRRLREVFRTNTFPPGLDVVIVPKREFFDASYVALEADVLAVVARRDRARRQAGRPREPAPGGPPDRPSRV